MVVHYNVQLFRQSEVWRSCGNLSESKSFAALFFRQSAALLRRFYRSLFVIDRILEIADSESR